MEKSYVTEATHPQTDYMSVAEVARRLGLSKMTVYRMCWMGDLAHIRTGPGKRVYRILRSDYERHATPVRNAPVPVIPGQTEITE
jgi:excisionase family DNA binding protein